jgi:hypothetical protein
MRGSPQTSFSGAGFFVSGVRPADQLLWCGPLYCAESPQSRNAGDYSKTRADVSRNYVTQVGATIRERRPSRGSSGYRDSGFALSATDLSYLKCEFVSVDQVECRRCPDFGDSPPPERPNKTFSTQGVLDERDQHARRFSVFQAMLMRRIERQTPMFNMDEMCGRNLICAPVSVGPKQ